MYVSLFHEHKTLKNLLVSVYSGHSSFGNLQAGTYIEEVEGIMA